MKRKLKRLYLLPFLLLAVACNNDMPETDEAVFVLSEAMISRCEFANASIVDVKNQLRLYGKITSDNKRIAQVYPVVGGVVTRIQVELGDFVKEGQVLATLRSSEVADFQRQKLDAEAEVAVSEKNLQVTRELFEGKLNSERDVISAEKELEKDKAELARINEVYSIFRLREGSFIDIVAPIAGYVVRKDINQNEQLRSDRADALFSIAQIDVVWALANVNESDIAKISIGYEADVQTIAYPDSAFTGKVDRIFNAIDPATKAMKIMIIIPNATGLLKPEMNATVTVRYAENKKMIAVPSSSVIFDKNKNWVMVFKDRSSIDTREVKVYRQLGETSYIAKGLEENEKVISKNGLLVYDAIND